MFAIFSVFAFASSTVVLGSVVPTSENLQNGDDSLWAPDCKSGLGKVPRLIPNPENCGSLFVCSRGALKEFFCPDGKVFSPERQECIVGDCRKGSYRKWPAFEGCPQDNSIVKYFKHEEDCAMFYQCDNGIAVPHRCAPGTVWNDDVHVKNCDHPWNVDCESRSFIRRRSKKNTRFWRRSVEQH